MNRTLRRPMFRIGGVAEGITSGLSPRQGYQGTGEAWDQFVKAVPGIKEQAKAAAYKPSRPGMSEFLINFGLDIASRPPSGSIFSTMFPLSYPCLGASPEVIPSAVPPILNIGLLKVRFIIIQSALL